jgi:hypothetical protein
LASFRAISWRRVTSPGNTTAAELSFGAADGQQQERNKAALADLTATLEIAPFDEAPAAKGADRPWARQRAARRDRSIKWNNPICDTDY